MNPDFLVIGAGVAGLRAAIELAEAGTVLVIAKDSLRESSSEYAQGGIAVALSDDDEVELHEQDTLLAGDGLCDRAAVRTLVEEGPAAIQQLIEWGAEFDRHGNKLAFTREGAHSRNRILHAHGDSTGREIARALYHKAARLPNVTFRTFAATTGLLLGPAGEAAGAMVWDAARGQAIEVRARAVLLATGGLGCVFLNTTNPDVATGDGVTIAYRAGAEIGDIEFVQFHPTALALEGAPRFLLSEALRGEGAALRNIRGERFTDELAPRDVVARAIVAEMRRTASPNVLLDLSHRGEEFVRTRFPRVYETCLRYGVNIGTGPAPVAPAAHYAMGGIWTDLDGRTTVPRLFAAGEVACTGVHGANRLASNSLLEGVVFGIRAGRAMRDTAAAVAPAAAAPAPLPELTPEIRRIAWERCGIVRSAEGLAEACARFETIAPDSVALLIARCALAREESRGAHFRTDFPAKSATLEKHSVIRKDTKVAFR
ncbi:MAG: L-aspartate oxidase [Acidobacteria bacterium]|nr:L-aspartate oxidase [Acidobacteriota bacterium]